MEMWRSDQTPNTFRLWGQKSSLMAEMCNMQEKDTKSKDFFFLIWTTFEGMKLSFTEMGKIMKGRRLWFRNWR